MKPDKLSKEYFKQAKEAGYTAMVALCFGRSPRGGGFSAAKYNFRLETASAVTGFKTIERANKYAKSLQAKFPKARVEVVLLPPSIVRKTWDEKFAEVKKAIKKASDWDKPENKSFKQWFLQEKAKCGEKWHVS